MSVVNFDEEKRRIEELKKPLERQLGGGDNGGMSMWEQSVETRLGELRDDVRHLDQKIDRNFTITWGGIILANIGLAGLLAKGFGWL